MSFSNVIRNKFASFREELMADMVRIIQEKEILDAE